MGTFKYGFCDDDCNNLGNVSFKSTSGAISSVYHSGWIESPDLRTPDNMTFLCEDNIGAGYCELSLRQGTEIIPANGSNVITRCIINQSTLCQDTKVARSFVSSGTSFLPGAIQDYDGILVDGSDTLYLGINETNVSAEYTGANYTLNVSAGYIDMMVTFK